MGGDSPRAGTGQVIATGMTRSQRVGNLRRKALIVSAGTLAVLAYLALLALLLPRP